MLYRCNSIHVQATMMPPREGKIPAGAISFIFLLYLDIQSTILDIPRAQETEIFPLSGNTFSLDIRPVNDVSITLFASPQTDSARYRFLLYDNTEKSTMYRSSKGGNDTIRQFVDTRNPQGQYPQRRTIWIDFRSSNLVLGSGGDVLLQWNDPSPFSVNYVSITSSITESTKITVYNKPHNRKFIFVPLFILLLAL